MKLLEQIFEIAKKEQTLLYLPSVSRNLLTVNYLPRFHISQNKSMNAI